MFFARFYDFRQFLHALQPLQFQQFGNFILWQFLKVGQEPKISNTVMNRVGYFLL